MEGVGNAGKRALRLHNVRLSLILAAAAPASEYRSVSGRKFGQSGRLGGVF